mmetsp:Transcript_14061/g.38647  ORF Transcript_14061/g.38647 Transcript_14061/m.38647 type:complete len:266 (+) Transcript_14061:16-813(+)
MGLWYYMYYALQIVWLPSVPIESITSRPIPRRDMSNCVSRFGILVRARTYGRNRALLCSTLQFALRHPGHPVLQCSRRVCKVPVHMLTWTIGTGSGISRVCDASANTNNIWWSVVIATGRWQPLSLSLRACTAEEGLWRDGCCCHRALEASWQVYTIGSRRHCVHLSSSCRGHWQGVLTSLAMGMSPGIWVRVWRCRQGWGRHTGHGSAGIRRISIQRSAHVKFLLRVEHKASSDQQIQALRSQSCWLAFPQETRLLALRADPVA